MSRYIGDGVVVVGDYNGKEVTGVVVSSRYIGNQLMYTVLLDNPLRMRWRDTLIGKVLLSNSEIKVALC